MARALRSATANLPITKVSTAGGLPSGIAQAATPLRPGSGRTVYEKREAIWVWGATVQEAGAVELVRGEGEFEVGEGGGCAGGRRGLALADCPALTRQHFGDVKLTNASPMLW